MSIVFCWSVEALDDLNAWSKVLFCWRWQETGRGVLIILIAIIRAQSPRNILNKHKVKVSSNLIWLNKQLIKKLIVSTTWGAFFLYIVSSCSKSIPLVSGTQRKATPGINRVVAIVTQPELSYYVSVVNDTYCEAAHQSTREKWPSDPTQPEERRENLEKMKN